MLDLSTLLKESSKQSRNKTRCRPNVT